MMRSDLARGAVPPPYSPRGQQDEPQNWMREIEQRALALQAQRDPERWRELLVMASPEQDEAMGVVAQLWAAPLPFEFRIMATALIQQRIEDKMPVPTHPGDPLRKELEALLTEQRRRTPQVS